MSSRNLEKLENLARTDRGLKKEAPSTKEFAGLVKSGQLRLKDAQNIALSIDSRFDVSYNAAHALALQPVSKLLRSAILR
ncbi:MAG: hypothetical protein KY410_06570 [Proteobacteria bacterium]|nr:hypothetical protein [Pseudomonadota bacterium]